MGDLGGFNLLRPHRLFPHFAIPPATNAAADGRTETCCSEELNGSARFLYFSPAAAAAGAVDAVDWSLLGGRNVSVG